MTSLQISLILLGISLGSVGGILLKIGSASLNGDAGITPFIISIITSPVVMLGFILYLIPGLIFTYLLKEMQISILQPILSLTYVTTAALAYFCLGEPVSLVRASGIVIIIVGVTLVAHS